MRFSRFSTIGLVKNGYAFKDINNNDSAFTDYSTGTTYEKLAPYLEIDFKQNTARSLFSNKLIVRHVTVLENKRNNGYFNSWNNQSISAFDATHLFKHKLATYSTDIKTNLQIGTGTFGYGKFNTEINQGIAYGMAKKKANIRLFGGVFFTNLMPANATINEDKTFYQLGGVTGNFDYLYDEAMLGRAETNQQQSLLARQVINRDAGFRNFVNIGSSKTWITALNLTLPFPIKLPIGLYADCVFGETFSYSNQTNTSTYNTKFNYVGGIYLSVAKNVFEVYFPVFASQDVLDSWGTDLQHPFNRASFILNLNTLNPVKIIKNAVN